MGGERIRRRVTGGSGALPQETAVVVLEPRGASATAIFRALKEWMHSTL